jgi:Invasion associated locus B (IalB) protein.
MFTRTCCFALSLMLGSAAVAGAQPTRIKQFDAWGVYSYTENGQKNCYALSVPVTQQPGNVNHGDNFVLVAPQGPGYAPQAIMGYTLNPSSEVKVRVDDKSFTMAPQDNAAWVKNQAREPEMVDAMRAGRELVIEATSKRGTNTSYAYSLKGVTAALNEVRKCN